MKSSLFWLLGGMAFLYFGMVVYAIYRGRDVKASLKLPFAILSFEAKGRGSRESNVLKER